jgi:hypothetical protein
MNTMTKKTITDELAWKFVQEFNWPKNYDKYARLKYKFLVNHADYVESFRLWCVNKVADLYRVVDEWEKKCYTFSTSDDGVNDLLWHILGMGKVQYFKHLKNPELIVKRSYAYQYRESFSYAVPSQSDQNDLITPQKYVDWAVKAFRQWSEPTTLQTWININEDGGAEDLDYDLAICARVASGNFKVTTEEKVKTRDHASKYGMWRVANLVNDLLEVDGFLTDTPVKTSNLIFVKNSRKEMVNALNEHWEKIMPTQSQWKYILKNGFVPFHRRESVELKKSLKKLNAVA